MTTATAIIKELFPTLINCARFADLLQHRIEAVADKENAPNIFAAALSDADLSIQAAVELAILSRFSEIPFFGEEWKASRNTKYLAGTNFIESSPYLITLDPIDGTRIYLDRKKLYQIILSVLTPDSFEAVIVLYPAYRDYVYAVRGQGAFYGTFTTALSEAKAWRLRKGSSRVYIAGEFHAHKADLSRAFKEVHSSADYSRDTDVHYLTSALRYELGGALLSSAQIIDGAALGFVAREMGYIVRMIDGSPLPAPKKYPELILPGMIVAEDEHCFEVLQRAAGAMR